MVFIVRPFGMKEGIDFDAVEQLLIQPALKAAGQEGNTTTNIAEAGNIREDMFRLLVTADLVIADLSIHNANVFYELGIRHGLRPQGTLLIRADVHALSLRSADRSLSALRQQATRRVRRQTGESHYRDDRLPPASTARFTRCCRAFPRRVRRLCGSCRRIFARLSIMRPPRENVVTFDCSRTRRPGSGGPARDCARSAVRSSGWGRGRAPGTHSSGFGTSCRMTSRQTSGSARSIRSSAISTSRARRFNGSSTHRRHDV